MKDINNEGHNLRSISYKVHVSVEPKWVEIFKYCFPRLQTKDEVYKAMNDLVTNPEFQWDNKASLASKKFVFIEFHDGISGLHSIWSEYHKSFVDAPVIWGDFFAQRGEVKVEEALCNKFDDNPFGRSMRVSPRAIGFACKQWEYSDAVDDICHFPFNAIKSLFLDIKENIEWDLAGGDCMVPIKRFPINIQTGFDKFKIQYKVLDVNGEFLTEQEMKASCLKADWLNDKEIQLANFQAPCHIFESPYHIVTLAPTYFRPLEIERTTWEWKRSHWSQYKAK